MDTPDKVDTPDTEDTLIEVVCHGNTILVCPDYCLSLTHVCVLVNTSLGVCYLTHSPICATIAH